MTTSHLPSFLTHNFTPFDSSLFNVNIKSEKLFDDDDVNTEVSEWFNEEYVSSPVSGDSCASSVTDSPVHNSISSTASAITHANQSTNFIPFNITLAGSSNGVSNIQGPPTSAFTPFATGAVASNNSNNQQIASVPTIYNIQGSYQPGVTFAYTQMVGQNGQTQVVQVPQIPITQLSPQQLSHVQQMNNNGQTQMVQQLSTPVTFQMNGQNVPVQFANIPQAMMLPNFTFSQQPVQVSAQYYPLFTQFQSLKPNGINLQPESESETDRKRNRQSQRPTQRRIRHTRPKVIEAKGAVQCRGRNRKKGSQCRNAALMEYIGPRPIYCAEHIELDQNSLYEKCKSSYQKDPGDKKGCKEVVLKEFGLCYKHYGDMVAQIVQKQDTETIRRHHERVLQLLDQLEREAAAAKKKDGDLYQRKNKLIPKFQEMKKLTLKAMEDLHIAPVQGDETSPYGSPITAPVLSLSDEEDSDVQLGGHDSPYSDLDTSKMIEHLSN